MALLGGRAGSDRPIILLFLVGACAIMAPALPGRAGEETAQEYEVKAAFLYNFTKFVEWPPSTYIGTEGTLVVGVIGEDQFDGILERTISGKTVNGRSLTIRRFAGPQELVPTHVLFVCRSEERRIDQILARVRSLPVLTVGEQPGRAARGVIIQFFIEESRVRFEIDPAAAKEAGLKLSSKLLGVARIVTHESERQE